MRYLNNLKVYRWRAGFDKAYEFAERVGIPSPTLSVIERGRANPSADLKATIVSVLDQALRARGEARVLSVQDVFPT